MNPENPQTNIIFAPLPPARELLKQAFANYNRYFWPWLAVYFPATLVIAGSSLLLDKIQIADKLKATKNLHDLSLISPALLGLALLLFLITIVVGLWGQAALIVAIKNSATGHSWLAAYRIGRKKIWPLFWTGLLNGLAVLAGFILLIIPGFILLVQFSQSSFVVIAEDKQGIAALRQSKDYVRGRWWPVTGRLLLIIFLMLLVSSLAKSATGHISGTYQIRIETIVTFLIDILTTPLFFSYTYLLFSKLKTP